MTAFIGLSKCVAKNHRSTDEESPSGLKGSHFLGLLGHIVPDATLGFASEFFFERKVIERVQCVDISGGACTVGCLRVHRQEQKVMLLPEPLDLLGAVLPCCRSKFIIEAQEALRVGFGIVLACQVFDGLAVSDGSGSHAVSLKVPIYEQLGGLSKQACLNQLLTPLIDAVVESKSINRRQEEAPQVTVALQASTSLLFFWPRLAVINVRGTPFRPSMRAMCG
mmetsp:Transcript_25131/g.73425  ORF Transcript_25131/g.73425 Transcript_25131/m.73425 type:complete len:223 (+) Transcript_25131:312-980(+)